MHERQPKRLRWIVVFCSFMAWLQMACGGGSAECKDGIQVSEYNTSGLKCTQPCDCSNLKYEGYCISGTCVSTTRNPAQRKGDIRPCKLLQKVGACEWGQQRAQPDPLKELVWGDCKAEEVGPSFVENTKARCLDGIDNDCDGLADFGDTKCNAFCTPTQILPCYTAASKTLNVGRCRSGLKTCQDDNTWGPCVGEKAPSKEICNKEDDDCNGLIDDGLTGCPSQICEEGQQRACYPDPVGCSAETDAQGIIRFRCRGICRAGFQTCQKGAWSSCEQISLPTTETCDGIDNNCDGIVDEGCPCEEGKEQACFLGPHNKAVGECVVGKQRCVKGKWDACAGAKAQDIEQCDGLDNNCDGQIDDFCACTKDADCKKQGVFCFSGICRKSDCPSGQVICAGDCVDLKESNAHCGTCNNACLGGTRCNNGSCGCSEETIFCAGTCVNTQTSIVHCGVCERACGNGKSCVEGKCVCPSGQEDCGAVCVELKSSVEHCGACNNACVGGATCQSGQCACQSGQVDCSGICADTQTSATHCGGCGKACARGDSCKAGRCVTQIRLAAGGNHACAVTDCNVFACWGINNLGQLGIPMSCNVCPPTPVALPLGADVVQVAAGQSFTCAVFSDGGLRCWGYNQNGQLGYGDTTDRLTPEAKNINLGSSRIAKSVAAGGYSACALLDDHSIRCWGYNGFGQLGDGSTTNRNTPDIKPINLGIGRNAKSISVGDRHICAILDNDSVKCWGANDYGQLGYDDKTNRSTPDANPINLGNGRSAKMITAGSFHTCAILDDGTAKCWGANGYGQLGYGDRKARTAPATAPIHLGTSRSAKSIAVGFLHTCVLLDDDTIKCWGDNSKGQLGYGDDLERPAPDTSPIDFGAGRSAKLIVAREAFACALLDDETLRCWGENNNGQVEYSTHPTHPQPAPPLAIKQIRCAGVCVSGIEQHRCGTCQTTCQTNQVCASGRCAPKPLQVAVGSNHTCALFGDGVRCWGDNNEGQLGEGNTTQREAAPARNIQIDTSHSTKSLALGDAHTCAILDNNTIKCWGDNSKGQLGYGDTTQRDAPDTNAVGLDTNRSAKSIAAGYRHTCAVLDNNTIKCWGDNSRGQLGYGDTTHRNSPDISTIHLGTLRSAKSIVAGFFHTCALLDNDAIKCWGKVDQIGYSNPTDQSAPNPNPIDLGTGRTAKSVAAGPYHTCAILDDRSIKCWGDNLRGQLGYGDTKNRKIPEATPILLGTNRTAKSLALGTSHTCAILDNDTVKCWGYNDVGQLGYGDTTQRNAPTGNFVDLGGGRTAKSIAMYGNHTCALLDDDSIKCWGANSSGQLGYGDTTQRNAPTFPLPLP